MMAMNVQVFERCCEVAKLDAEQGHEVRSCIAMAMAIADGDLMQASAILGAAASVAAFSAGVSVEEISESIRVDYNMLARAEGS